eukprot:14845727-Alexandrium_andersonii.AAC.1
MPRAPSTMRRWMSRVEPAFSMTACTTRSPRMLCASRAIEGMAQKSIEEGPHTPRAPAVAPANVRP